MSKFISAAAARSGSRRYNGASKQLGQTPLVTAATGFRDDNSLEVRVVKIRSTKFRIVKSRSTKVD